MILEEDIIESHYDNANPSQLPPRLPSGTANGRNGERQKSSQSTVRDLPYESEGT